MNPNRDYRRDYPVERPRFREPKPMPIGDKCNPLCPFFRCGKKALRITREHYRGRNLKVAMCNWIGDKCIGATCRFAYCEKRAILPDGRCAFAVKGKSQMDFEEELRREERYSISSKRLRIDEDLY
ncbi:MAG: hypothetical protein GSR85_09625 [Desulfurococcales archaeon]|nr:hypothetical protein [Desulfurococcales archaeon]